MTGKYTVIVSKNHNFKYYDEKKIESSKLDFQPSTQRVQMKFAEFVEKINNWKKGDDRYDVVYLKLQMHSLLTLLSMRVR